MLPGTAARFHPETDPAACFSIHAAAEPVAASITRYNFFYTTGFVESDP